MTTWWRRRREAARGGHIPGLTAPERVPFTPTPIDSDDEVKKITQKAAGLVPGAVDDALPYTLDNEINARADQWIAQVHSEFAQAKTWLGYLLDRADADLTHQVQRQPPDTHRVIETEAARNAAAVRLRGEQEKPAWAEPGHADPTALAGGSSGRFAYAVAIVLAAAADIVAFYQVIEIVLGNLPVPAVLALVVALTGLAIALAHYTGKLLRDRRAGAKWVHTAMIAGSAAVWVTLGVVAFWVRLHSGAPSGSSFVPSVTGGQAPASSGAVSSQSTPSAAALFAGLYAATGAVTLVGAYLTHNPLRHDHGRVMRAHRKAAGQHAIAARRLGLAEAERNFYAAEIIAAEKVRDEAIQFRLALSEELKQAARTEFARRLADASATDAFVTGDARPYTYRPFPNEPQSR